MSRIHHYAHVHLQGLQLGELKKELLSNKHNETETPLRIIEERLVLGGKINDVKTVRRWLTRYLQLVYWRKTKKNRTSPFSSKRSVRQKMNFIKMIGIIYVNEK